ncbi:flagellar basal body rod protein FlgC [Varunaivibrio sulfuroxidans]|uniref:Flagellar basal-body rod protein FlgC n=1 Tax=Varunaivibrio sulfuroxidans TaxID=1773489 RepID=A0A4R3JCE3_9PROT|nr:flagellar basal body rod protein FlgC [Varunaivibrio sulfuroxidans]TCS63035.1 flagellar basal-body rod protein FlgC [Varunaivibrio sulfuroxidans]WES31890.1 flagellar basal body rod protein FlgC [Varunaivibrio sulfuroxidans]
MDDLLKTLRISSSGMKAQGTRLRVISENIANASSLPKGPGELPYRRKIVTFRNQLDRATGIDTVRVDRVTRDRSDFGRRYDPSHPAADANGYVLTPNVNSLIEMMDMREAQRSYEANLNVLKTSKGMLQETIGLLR